MPHQLSESLDSICSILSCTSDEFLDYYEDAKYPIELLLADAQTAITFNGERLREADPNHRLDILLTAMLDHAPDPLGKRYVAIALHIAHNKGGDEVIHLAQAWLEYLFQQMLGINRIARIGLSGYITPTIVSDTTIQPIEGECDAHFEQRKFRQTVAKRENYRCAITWMVDRAYVEFLVKQKRSLDGLPDQQSHMEVAHIIPFSFDDLNDSTGNPNFWDMLRCWTNVDIGGLVGSNINSPENAIYTTMNEHRFFGRFEFYLDKEAYPNDPNKYKVRMSRSYFTVNGKKEFDVEFPTEDQSGVKPPNPTLLKIHASFAQVLNLSGAAEHFDYIERDAEQVGALRSNGETDVGLLLMSRLAVP